MKHAKQPTAQAATQDTYAAPCVIAWIEQDGSVRYKRYDCDWAQQALIAAALMNHSASTTNCTMTHEYKDTPHSEN